MTIDYSKWSTVDDEEEDDGPAPSDDGRRPLPPSCAPAAAAAAANVSRQGFHDFVDAHKEALVAFAALINDDDSSERALIASPVLLDPLAARYLLLHAVDLQASGQTSASLGVARQLALASLCSDTARSMPGCDPREAARQVFVRLRSEAPSGPYAEARKAFETHLASCVERVRQRASTELSSLRALEVAARGAISNGNGGTGSSRTSSCSAAADAPEHPPPPSSKSGCADGKCDTGQDDDSGGSAWARAAGCFVPSFVAGMLGSSCCLIQILLNSLAVGCAGFNKVLGGRVRGPLRLLSCVWLAVLWQRALVRRRGRRDAALSTLLCLGLTLLPEALLYSGSGRAMAPGLDGSERPVLLRVEGMGCEACESHVRAVIERSSGVVSSRVDFTVGEARLLVSDRWGFDADGLRSRLREDGYDASVVASQDAAAASGGEAPDEDAHHDERQRKEEL